MIVAYTTEKVKTNSFSKTETSILLGLNPNEKGNALPEMNN